MSVKPPVWRYLLVCFSNFNVHASHWRILLRSRFGFGQAGLGPDRPHTSSPSDASAASLNSTLGVARIEQTV